MNVNSLDARAFGARGGLGDGLADVIRAIAGGYLQNQDRADARLDRQVTLSAELRRRNEDIGRQDRIRAEDLQRQDARYAVTDADRVWQRDRTESQDAATQAERDRVAGRQGLADALEQASKYGVVPQRPDFVTAPTEREQAVWGAANRGAEDRSLSAELKRAQAREADARGMAAMTRPGKGEATQARERWQIISDDSGKKYRVNLGTGMVEPLVLASDSAAPAVPAAPARPGEDGKVAFPTPSGSNSFWTFRQSGTGGKSPTLGDLMTMAVGGMLDNGPGGGGVDQPSVAAPPAPAPNPRAAAIQTIDQERDALAGMGIDHRLLLSPDLNQRRAVLARMPIDARRRAIDALRIIDSTATR